MINGHEPDSAIVAALSKQHNAASLRANPILSKSADNLKFADELDKEANRLLATKHAPKLGPGGEVIVAQDATLPTAERQAVDTLSRRSNIIPEDASAQRLALLDKTGLHVLPMALDIAETVRASNSLEKILAHQTAAAHKVAMDFMAKGGDLRRKLQGRPSRRLPLCQHRGEAHGNVPSRCTHVAEAADRWRPGCSRAARPCHCRRPSRHRQRRGSWGQAGTGAECQTAIIPCRAPTMRPVAVLIPALRAIHAGHRR